MNAALVARSRADAGPRTYLTIAGVLIAVALGFRAAASGIEVVRTMVLIFGSLMIQALPFVVIGAIASAVIEVFVPVSTIAKLSRLPRPLQLPAAALSGVAFPICECGSVPVARGLMSKGLDPSAAIAFMLAAPIVNPVVIASTVVAFRTIGSPWSMAAGRFGLGIVVACVVGWVVGGGGRSEGLLKKASPGRELPVLDPEPQVSRGARFFQHLTGDLMFMGKYLVIGASLAAIVQTILPSSSIAEVAGLPVLSILAMMGLAALLSLCSESDAFVAASFTGFGPSAQLAFLVFGPMVDLKLAALYTGTFRAGFTRTVIITAGATTLVATMWLQVVLG